LAYLSGGQDNDPSQEDEFDLDAILSQELRDGGYFEYESDDEGFSDSTLSDEQARVIDLVRRRKNVFITGPAGSINSTAKLVYLTSM
jgi:hypothetical protein